MIALVLMSEKTNGKAIVFGPIIAREYFKLLKGEGLPKPMWITTKQAKTLSEDF